MGVCCSPPRWRWYGDDLWTCRAGELIELRAPAARDRRCIWCSGIAARRHRAPSFPQRESMSPSPDAFPGCHNPASLTPPARVLFAIGADLSILRCSGRGISRLMRELERSGFRIASYIVECANPERIIMRCSSSNRMSCTSSHTGLATARRARATDAPGQDGPWQASATGHGRDAGSPASRPARRCHRSSCWRPARAAR